MRKTHYHTVIKALTPQDRKRPGVVICRCHQGKEQGNNSILAYLAHSYSHIHIHFSVTSWNR